MINITTAHSNKEVIKYRKMVFPIWHVSTQFQLGNILGLNFNPEAITQNRDIPNLSADVLDSM